MTLLRSAALSDIGRVRRNNEDRFLCDEHAQIFGVADGVGGLPGGAEAAQFTVDQIAAAVSDAGPNQRIDLSNIVQRVSHRVHALGADMCPGVGIGSTLTFGIVRGATIHVAHVGDSRCYLWRKGELIQVTDDHSVENEARLRRARGEVVYYQEGNRNALTRCMGQPGAPAVDVIERTLRAGDRYLFCTDGITRVVRDSELSDILGQPHDPEEILREIVALAIRRGGPDNATGVLVFVDEV